MRSPFLFVLFILILLPAAAEAQWVNDPVNNLMVCDTTGEQALAKIVATTDGGNYISWFDTRSGQYCVYLQKLDPLGNKLWGRNGLLVSSNTQDTWIADYDLICDAQNNAILVFTDLRNSGNSNPFAYKISPTGQFLWGPNGVDLNNSTDAQYNPRVTQTNDGSFVIAWMVWTTPAQVAVQKLSSDGSKLWGTTPITIVGSGNQPCKYPTPVPSDNNSVIIVHTFVYGTTLYSPVNLRAQKLNANGQKMWGIDGINIQNLATIPQYRGPAVISDNNNGAIIGWDENRDGGLEDNYVQRIGSDSTKYFPENGVCLSLNANKHRWNPTICFDPAAQSIYGFWLDTDEYQTEHGISGQRITSTGVRAWGDNGKILKELSAPNTVQFSYFNSKAGQNIVYLVYLDGDISGLNTKVVACALNSNGEFLWTGNFVGMSTMASDKLQMVTAIDMNNNIKAAWGDKRSDDSGIYAQDINMYGQLGSPVVPVELVSFNASLSGSDVVINWTTASEKNNYGFEIDRSRSNGAWENLGFVKGSGTTTSEMKYSYTDKTPAPGTYTYRLKQIDLNGTYEYVSSAEVEVLSPAVFSLSQNYPNPFNPTTTITFSMPENSFVTLKIFNSLGEEVQTLVNGSFEPGIHKTEFNASSLPSGLYFYTLSSGNSRETKKMMLMK